MKSLLLILSLLLATNAWADPVNLLCEEELDPFVDNPNKYVYFFQLDVEKESLNIISLLLFILFDVSLLLFILFDVSLILFILLII